MKKVYKYATGVEIPEDAQYLSSQVEKETVVNVHSETGDQIINERNILVWHYFLVEVGDEG